ncbi:serpin B [Prevotella aff. ruminicola Tc2-24]|uniref:Serpin B n=2 Tax=Prevotella aff. ruminicola Tc2-24 TaxID=81582 RepID=A0A1I0PPQ6_9BACT|nr:serpin B [Prevotella aff. ruminicola Tc2-24]
MQKGFIFFCYINTNMFVSLKIKYISLHKKRQLIKEMKIRTILGYSYRVIEVLFILYISACVFAGCKGSSKKNLLKIAAMTEEDYRLSDEQKIMVRNSNEFAVNLFKKICEEREDSNVFVSTTGMLYSLNIINNGASGQTQQEICHALNIVPTDVERINNLCRRFMIGQAKVTEHEFLGPTSYMRTATLFQAGEDIDISKSFQEVLEYDYFAGIIKGKIDNAMKQKIKKWCAEKTEGLIKDFNIKENGKDSATLLVANYFNGRWVQEFDKGSTKEEPFYGGTSPKVNMMNMKECEKVFSYAKLDDYSMLKIPYVGGYALYIILPDKADGLTALLQSLEGRKIRYAMSCLKSYDHVYIKIPKFEVDYTFKANECLASLGIKKLFSNDSQLTRIQSRPMKVIEILQSSKVILDEDGTRAGAITSTSFATLSSLMHPTEAYFYADHPFAYIIADPFGNYCFMGTFWGNE